MNLPNLLTLSRIPLMVIVVALLHPWEGKTIPWLWTTALVLFLFGALTDWMDGWLARRLGQVSDFGKFMDALVDKIFTMGTFVSMLALGIIGLWALFPILLILSREFLITGLRLIAAAQGKTLAAEKAGKVKTVMQITSICLFIAKGALVHDLSRTQWLATSSAWIEPVGQAAQITLVMACVLTVYSGVNYLVKYWNVFIGKDSGKS
ncbi:CDP-diacylglycerol--glycerol-3-phosphate 3-phosphatidyltransferase [Opitutales bacterium]|nr:CDP-diacylglycerol--glycerol-3-phosphate 3-phosphatidyltransferase [Opitutales bacterium]